MDVTNHCIKRYVERIQGVEGEKEVKQYITLHKEEVADNVRKIFEFAKHLYRGQIGDNVTRNYYLRDNIILVTNTGDTAIITLYKCDFGFPESTNRKVIKDLLEIIEKLHAELEVIETEFKEQTVQDELEIERIDTEIAAVKARIESLESRKKAIQEMVKTRKASSTSVQKQLAHYAQMLCNSRDYKKDLADASLK